MEAVQVQLPSELLQRIRQEIPSDEALSQVVEEAVQMWLDNRHAQKIQGEKGLHVLRKAGMVMDSSRQRALAEAIMPPLDSERTPDREQVETALSRLKVPLSEEIMAMRGER